MRRMMLLAVPLFALAAACSEITSLEQSNPGSILARDVYIPANAPHTLIATPEEDVIFIAIKDLSQGIIGKAVDGTMSGPHYDPGYGPKRGR